MVDSQALRQFVNGKWDAEIIPLLIDYIKIPCKSPHFDHEWDRNGHIDQAVELAENWVKSQPVRGLHVEVIRIDGRTPVLFFEVQGDIGGTVLMYGHLDKQPEMVGWSEGLGPWSPKIIDEKLYGRGGADDGYSVFASITAVSALQQQGEPLPRIVGLIECCEESGSYDLPYYLRSLSSRIGDVDLVIGLDSGCGNYDQLWLTTSLRGMVAGTLHVEVLSEGVHSGDASGIVPSSFRIARSVLSRLEDEQTGSIIDSNFCVEIPENRLAEAELAGQIIGPSLLDRFPFEASVQPMTQNFTEAVLNRTWRPFLSVIGADHIPPIVDAGNVLRPKTSLKLSLRIPPTVDAEVATKKLKQLLEENPPYGAIVRFEPDQSATGWNAPTTSKWLYAALQSASEEVFGKDVAMMGEGGTIPFMGMLGDFFPQAQFVITGVLGPKSNAHGPNEFLHLPYAKRLTEAVALVLAQFPR